ncbi:hypothetical protein SDC9_168476 [bioreactor metagenome]|uniref:Uncharacterized protein n=1 Tax=bioreactor metagenome TaxID=1076179 RepID=A0A645G2K0_9ZZZZ
MFMYFGVIYMIEKIIVRKITYQAAEIELNLLSLLSEVNVKSLQNLKKAFSDRDIFLKLFNEDLKQEFLNDSVLYNHYLEASSSGKENDYFSIMYKIKDDLAVELTEHIKLHHICNDLLINDERIIPWECIDSEFYIADTWWESDEDILKDFKELCFLDFIDKYKVCLLNAIITLFGIQIDI